MKNIPVRQILNEQPLARQMAKFRIRDLQDMLAGEDMVHELHRHDFFFVLAVQSGSGTHEIDFVAYPVCDGSIYFLRPGQVHKLTLTAGTKGYLLEFSADFYHPEGQQARQRFLAVTNKNFCRSDPQQTNRLHALLASVLREYHENLDGQWDAIKAHLDILFIEIIRQRSNPDGATNAPTQYAQNRLEEFLELLEEHIREKKQASQYAQLMNLSLFQLNSITKSTLGKVASAIIQDSIILEAKRYLLATASQVKDIADRLGYEDVSYFIRFFKKHCGAAPDTFRQNAGR